MTEQPVTPSPVDDEEIRAFIAGWNAHLEGVHNFDMALHWWLRERAGINDAVDLIAAALDAGIVRHP